MVQGKMEEHDQTLINKHSKVVYVGWTWITLCEKETSQLPAITNTHPTFLAFHMCLEFIYSVQLLQWKYTEQSDATIHTLPMGPEISHDVYTKCSESHNTKPYILTLCCHGQQHSGHILEHLCSAIPLYEPQNPHNTEHTDNFSSEYFVKVNVALNPYT